jgi:hypothetical protein
MLKAALRAFEVADEDPPKEQLVAYGNRLVDEGRPDIALIAFRAVAVLEAKDSP